jgi:RimJ/RimL family protein N-acetyltransferase
MIIGKNINLREVEVRDAEFILSLRLDPELNAHISATQNDLAKQREWIERYISLKKDKYFIIQDKQSNAVGTVRIYDMLDNCFCWGSWIVRPEARNYASLESAVLLYEYAFFDLGFNLSKFDVRKANHKALNFHIKFGATITSEDEQDFFMTFHKKDFIQNRNGYLKAINEILIR